MFVIIDHQTLINNYNEKHKVARIADVKMEAFAQTLDQAFTKHIKGHYGTSFDIIEIDISNLPNPLPRNYTIVYVKVSKIISGKRVKNLALMM